MVHPELGEMGEAKYVDRFENISKGVTMLYTGNTVTEGQGTGEDGTTQALGQ